MKHMVSILLILGIVFYFTACDNTPEKQKEEVAATTEEPVVEASGTENLPTEVVLNNEPLYVADAAMYRGTIIEMKENELVLEQYEGRDYGYPTLTVMLTEGTRISGANGTLAVGDYIEVFYGVDLSQASVEKVDAIAINPLGTAESRVFNALIVSVEYDATTPEKGQIFATNLEGEGENIIHFSADGTTQLYLDKNDLQPGAKIAVLHDADNLIPSIPAELFALEITMYTSKEDSSAAPEEPIQVQAIVDEDLEKADAK